ncbi:TonB-dependent receptor [Gammaproteobacteria bacterium]|nr:TonB-dependent receptor [Gammaproteobacteria bacterium]
MPLLLLLLGIFSVGSSAVDIEQIESVTIIGSKIAATEVPGAASFLSNQDLKKTIDTDIHKILSLVPGIFFRAEDGHGLRPNISIRGTSMDRSAKITLMEDGILIAPAPYTSAAAYYFPTPGRMNAVEVLKGPSAISQGPSTIGGAINLVSTPIPELPSGNIAQEFGDNDMSRTHAFYGGTTGNLGALIEVHEHSSDGFDSIAGVDRDTGFNKSDLMAKLRYSWGDHEVTLKIIEADESSEQTYVGLSQLSFQNDPRKRYGMSQYDEMANAANQKALIYKGRIGMLDIIATSWTNDYHRDWFKVDKANNLKEHGIADGIDNVIAAANDGNKDAQEILDGKKAVQVQLKHNNRYYRNEGLQLQASANFSNHKITFGLRDMKDAESRYQWYECFDQISASKNSALYACGSGYSGANNRLRETVATSFFIQDTLMLGKFAITIGQRSENYRQVENRWLDGTASRNIQDSIYSNKKSRGDYQTSGLGFTYSVNNNLKLIAGFHEGMSPVFNGDAEEADNLELGFRYNNDLTLLEIIYFSSDYQNLVGTCSNSSGGNCEAGASFSGGEVDVSGLEITSSWVLEGNNIRYPISIAFTSTKAIFNNSFSNDDYWGTVMTGDNVPYIPSSVLAIQAGVLTESGWSGYLRLLDHGGACSSAACGTYERIGPYSFVDLTLRKSINNALDLYGVIENIMNNEDIASRAPKNGARSQKPQTFKIGFSYKF